MPSSLPARLAALLAKAAVLNKPGIVPDQYAVIEVQQADLVIGEADTQGTETFDLDGPWVDADAVHPQVTLSSPTLSGGAADPGRMSHEVTSVTAAQVQVEVTLDTAPGAGETTTVTVYLTATGHGE